MQSAEGRITMENLRSISGLPIGLQIAGRAFDEAAVLRVAHTYERHTAWRQKRPPN
jgi:aspartyl-tRNA(Asn)/glutamyl-tRNA(Gln) amidotransferase subunit A